jgi:hypothetical protein
MLKNKGPEKNLKKGCSGKKNSTSKKAEQLVCKVYGRFRGSNITEQCFKSGHLSLSHLP